MGDFCTYRDSLTIQGALIYFPWTIWICSCAIMPPSESYPTTAVHSIKINITVCLHALASVEGHYLTLIYSGEGPRLQFSTVHCRCSRAKILLQQPPPTGCRKFLCHLGPNNGVNSFDVHRGDGNCCYDATNAIRTSGQVEWIMLRFVGTCRCRQLRFGSKRREVCEG